MKKERWRWVVGQKGRYMVSSLGRVRSVDRWVVSVNGRERFYKGMILSPASDQDGYQLVSICMGRVHNGKRVKLSKVHRLVLEAFVGPCPLGHECAHGDGNPKNNELSNLSWKTIKENHDDKRRHGTSNDGERNGRALLTRQDVLLIRRRLSEGVARRILAEHYSVGVHVISRIARNETWRNV